MINACVLHGMIILFASYKMRYLLAKCINIKIVYNFINLLGFQIKLNISESIVKFFVSYSHIFLFIVNTNNEIKI